MRHRTISENKVFKNPPDGVSVFMMHNDMGKSLFEVWFDMCNLEHVNFVRENDGKSKINNLNGYCMSSGCSCRHQNGSKGRPDCGLFRPFDSDGIKKDFLHQMFGI